MSLFIKSVFILKKLRYFLTLLSLLKDYYYLSLASMSSPLTLFLGSD